MGPTQHPLEVVVTQQSARLVEEVTVCKVRRYSLTNMTLTMLAGPIIALKATFVGTSSSIWLDVSCCSGAFSMFRKKIYEAIGGNNSGPGEDFELTLRVRKLGYKVRFVSDAFASVEAPASFDGLVRQRLRWDRDAPNIRVNQ